MLLSSSFVATGGIEPRTFHKVPPVRLLTPSIIIVIMDFFSFGAEGVFCYIIPDYQKMAVAVF